MKRSALVAPLLLCMIASPAFALDLSVLSALSPKASTLECQNAWSASTARRSCDVIRIEGRSGNLCRIEASCRANAGHYIENRYTMEEWGVRALANCNGFLKVGGC